MADTLTQQLAEQKRRYEEAKLRGDTATMEAAHQEANRLRAMGASEAAANRMVYGRESGYYAGWTPTTSSRSTSSTTSSWGTSSSRTDSRLADAYQRALGHVQYFGSPEEYARQIISKGPSNLSDLAAAKAFIAARPDLFTQEQALSILTYGLPTYSDTGDVLGPTHILAGSNWGIGGNTLFLPSAQQAESRLYIKSTPVGTVGVWVNPVTGQVSTSAPPELKGATGIPELPPYWQQQLVRELLQQQMQYQQQQVQPIQQLQAQITPYIDELKRIAQDVNVETAPVVMSAYNQIMGMIDRVQAELIDWYERMGQGIDPATQAALASLRETVKRQRENLMEEMSRRGLLQSGIWLEMESRLNRGLLTEEQRLLANRLSQLQNQLNQALASLASARIQTVQWLGTEQIRQAEAAAQRRQQAIATLAQVYRDIADRLAQIAMEQQRRAWEAAREQQRLAWEREKYYTPTWEQQARVTGVIPPLYPGDPSAVIRQAQAEWWDAYSRGDEEGMRRAHEKAEAARAAAGWPSGGESGVLTEHLMTPAGLPAWEREKAARDWEEQWRRALLAAETSLAKQQLQASRRSAAGGTTGGTRRPTLTEIRAQETGSAMTAVANALDQGVPLDAVIADIYRQTGQLVASGVDPDKLAEYARNYAMYQQQGLTPPEDTSGAGGGTSLWDTISRWLPELPNVFAYPQP